MRRLKPILIFLLCITFCNTTFAVKKSIKKPHNKSIDIGLFSRIDTLHGVSVNAILSASNNTDGVQISLISNATRKLRGVQLASFSNISLSPLAGLQLSPVSNISMGVKRGVQLSALVNVCSGYMRGYQMSAYNYADTLNGSQIGILNVCINHPKGVQIGIINYSRDTVAHKIGLVNVNPKTKTDFMAYIGSSSKFNIAVRFRNRSTYSILGFGTHYMGLDNKFSGALFYRLGQYFALNPKLTISGDVGYYHVETFEENSSDKPQRLYSLQLRVNLDYQINKTVGSFVTLGYGDTRYYSHSKEYRNRSIVEAGITLKYHRHKGNASL